MENRNTRKKIVRDVLALFSRSVIVRVLHFPVSIIVARVLGPAGYGLLNIINYIPSLTKYGSLGYDSAAYREIAHLRGAQKNDQESHVKDVAFTADFAWSLLLSLLVLGISFGYEDPKVRWGLRIAAVTLFLKQWGRLYAVQLKLNKNFAFLAKVQVISEIVVSAFILATIWWWGIFSVLIAGAISAALMLLLCRRLLKSLFAVRLEWNEWYRITKIAVPMAMVTLAYGAFGWIERGLIGALFGLRLLGIYMLTVTLLKATMSIVNSTLLASSIHVYERLGQSSDHSRMGGALTLPTLSFAFVLPVLGATIIFIGGPVIALLLPEYMDVVPYLPWVAAILWVRALPTLYGTSMNSRRLNQQGRLVAYVIVMNVVFAAVTWGLSHLDYGLAAPLAAKLLSFIILSVLIFGATSAQLWTARHRFWKDIAQYMAPFLWGAVAVFTASSIDVEGWLGAFVRIGVFLVLYSPPLWYWEKKVGLIREILGSRRLSLAAFK